jgi:hypothetical protein
MKLTTTKSFSPKLPNISLKEVGWATNETHKTSMKKLKERKGKH